MLLGDFRVVGALGARQVERVTPARQLGKTLARPVTAFDLEDPRDLARLADPMLVLRDLDGVVILDEV